MGLNRKSLSDELFTSWQTEAAKHNLPVVFPEGEDERVIEAVKWLAAEQICRPIVLTAGKPLALPSQIEVIDTQTDSRISSWGESLADNKRYNDRMTHPLVVAALLVKNDYACGGVAGAQFTTAEVIKAGLHIIGPVEGIKTISSNFVICGKDKLFSFADCAVVIDPSASQLADIALATALTHRQLTGQEVRLAFLSFSTKGSASHPQVTKVQQACQILQTNHPDICCDGELQLDAALVPDVAHRKAPSSAVAGDANVLIFPDLASGNIAYKLAQYIGGLKAIGPIVQGLAAPFMDLSRGCTAEDIIMMSCVTTILARQSAISH